MTKKNFWSRWWCEITFRCERTSSSSMVVWAASSRPSLRLALFLMLVPVWVGLFPSALHAATITVNTTGDPGPSGTCDLRDAITNANGKDQSGSINCVGGSGIDTIVFRVSGTITLGSSGTLPDIVNTLTIDGSGQTITIDGDSMYQPLFVNSGATLNLVDLTISHGIAAAGGGVYNDFGTLTVTNCTFSDNTAAAGGGGVYNDFGTLTVTNCTFSDNIAAAGGAIYNGEGTVTVTNCTFSGNIATSDGDGGALYNTASLTVDNSTFSGNIVTGGGSGGGIFNGGGKATVIYCTFSGNRAGGGAGGALYNSASLRVDNSILADSTGGNCIVGGGDAVTDGGYNISDDSSCGFAGTGANGKPIGDNVSDANIKLDPDGLANNGGPTQTIALEAGSYAIDAVPIARCSSTDQRGAPRPDPATPPETACDIGSFESGNQLWLTPPSLNFGTAQVGKRSAPQSVTLGNDSGQDLKIRKWSIGVNYTIVSTTCPSPPSILPTGESCTFEIAFRPIYGGVRNELFQVYDNFGTQFVRLSGSGGGK